MDGAPTGHTTESPVPNSRFRKICCVIYSASVVHHDHIVAAHGSLTADTLAGELAVARMPQDEMSDVKQLVANIQNGRAVVIRAYEALQYALQMKMEGRSTRTATGSRVTRSKHISYHPPTPLQPPFQPPGRTSTPPPAPSLCLHHALTHHGTDQGAEG